MKEGVFDVIPAGSLDSLTSEDLRLLLNGVGDINVTTLISYTSFNDESGETSERLVTFKRWLWAVIEKMSPLDKQDLVYFWTGEITLHTSLSTPLVTNILSSQDPQLCPLVRRDSNPCRASPSDRQTTVIFPRPTPASPGCTSLSTPGMSRLKSPLPIYHIFKSQYFSKQILKAKLQLAIKTKNFGFV